MGRAAVALILTVALVAAPVSAAIDDICERLLTDQTIGSAEARVVRAYEHLLEKSALDITPEELRAMRGDGSSPESHFQLPEGGAAERGPVREALKALYEHISKQRLNAATIFADVREILDRKLGIHTAVRATTAQVVAERERARLRVESFRVKGAGWVNALALTPDGKSIVVGYRNQKPKLIDLASGKVEANFPRYKKNDKVNMVYSVGISRDSGAVGVGSSDGVLRIWDRKTQKLFHRVSFGSTVDSIAFSPDNDLVAIASSEPQSKIAEVWDYRKKQLSYRLESSQNLKTVAFSKDGARLYTGGQGSANAVWDARTGKRLEDLDTKGSLLWSLATAADGSVAGGGADGTIHIWTPKGQAHVSVLGEPAHFMNEQFRVNALSFSPDGKIIVAVNEHGVLSAWSSEGQLLRKTKLTASYLRAISFFPTQTAFVTGLESLLKSTLSLKIWDLDEYLAAKPNGDNP